jgi:hypothetical protein
MIVRYANGDGDVYWKLVDTRTMHVGRVCTRGIDIVKIHHRVDLFGEWHDFESIWANQ